MLELSRVRVLKPGIQAKLIAKSAKNGQMFDTNIEVIEKQIHKFCGSIKTSLNILKNHQKEKRDDIDNIVRKLVTCCHGNFTRENKAKEGTGSNDWSDKGDMDSSRDDADISDILG